mgnify:CR=1 FL=1
MTLLTFFLPEGSILTCTILGEAYDTAAMQNRPGETSFASIIFCFSKLCQLHRSFVSRKGIAPMYSN